MLSERPWKLDAIVRLMLGIAICICFVQFAAALIQHFHDQGKLPQASPLFTLIANLGLHASILVAITVFLRLEHIRWRDAFGFATPGLGFAILLGLVVGLAFIPLGMSLQWLSLKAMGLFSLPTPEQPAVQILKSAGPGLDRISLIIFTVFIAPPAEEMFFRGILYPTIKQYGYPRLALWGTALLFALIHFNPPIFVPLTALALALTFLYEKTNNLLACIVAHAAFNAANVVLLYVNDPGFHPPH
jgi:membrane protease YdiL (CAAX protease family)